MLRNSRNAHLTALYAREHDAFGAVHAALFAAYFSAGHDISDIDLLSQISRDAGLPEDDLRSALRDRRYIDRLALAQEEAAALGVTGVPAFFIGEKERIVGAQPIEVFRKALKAAKKV
jgi:predicted DsbA family dithiol-disulfide isomerase